MQLAGEALAFFEGGLAAGFGEQAGVLLLGPMASAARFALFAGLGIGGSYWITFFPASLVLAILVPAVTTVALNSAEPRYSGLASAINNSFS